MYMCTYAFLYNPTLHVGKASKPLRELITFVVDVLHFKNKAETLVVFLVGSVCCHGELP